MRPPRRAPLSLLFLLCLLAVPACRATGDVCHEAADLCGASGEFDGSACRGAEKAYAECLVDAGDCEPQTAADCAAASPGDSGGVTLTVQSFQDIGGLFDVDVEIANVSVAQPVPVSTSFFLLEDTVKNQRVPSGGTCQGGQFLAQGGSEVCNLQYSVPADFLAVKIVFHDSDGHLVEAELGDGQCPAGAENTQTACSDGCSNDGDEFVDCDDFDCCEVRPDCPESSACGQENACASGPEDTFELCSDNCSNDGDSFIDCDDFDCCPVRPDCPVGTACGDQ